MGLALTAPAIMVFGLGPTLAVCALVCVLAPVAAALAPGSKGFTPALRS